MRALPRRESTHTSRPTLADVARNAGVSTATVSYVVNDRDAGISGPTKQRVLRGGRSARVSPGPPRSSNARRADAHDRADHRRDRRAPGRRADDRRLARRRSPARQPAACSCTPPARSTSCAAVVEDLLDRRVDALAYAVAGTRAVEHVEHFGHVPTVLVNCFAASWEVPCILPAEAAGGRAATELVLAAGHRRVAYLGGHRDSWATRQRVKGFRAALRRAGVKAADAPVLAGNFRSDSGYELTRQVLRRRPAPDSGGVRQRPHGRRRLLRPQGTTACASPTTCRSSATTTRRTWRRSSSPALTTIRLPYYEMGAIAAEALLDDSTALAARVDVGCPPIVRRSVAAITRSLTLAARRARRVDVALDEVEHDLRRRLRLVHLPDGLADEVVDQSLGAVARPGRPGDARLGLADEDHLQRHRQRVRIGWVLPLVGPRRAQLARRLARSSPATATCPRTWRRGTSP